MIKGYPPHFKLPVGDRNFFETNIDPWWQVVSNLIKSKEDQESRVAIEIGSLHGASAVWLLENFINRPIDFLHCIDINETEYLKKNLAPYKNVKLHLGMSSNVLIELWNEYKRPIADIIYVDGSHLAKHVLEDGVLSWKLLKINGILIFDDYYWGESGTVDDMPKTGIDAFMNGFCGHWRNIAINKLSQIYLQKMKYDIKDRQLTGNYANHNPFFNEENL